MGSHVIVFSSDPDADRAFFVDALGHRHVDAGGGWLIFKMPPAELAVHPADGSTGHELYFMCDDLQATMGVCRRGASSSPTAFPRSGGKPHSLPVARGGEVGIYEPRHPLAIDL